MDAGHIGLYHITDGDGLGYNGGETNAAAIVVHVNEDSTMNIRVFTNTDSGPLWLTGIAVGTEPGEISPVA